MSMTGEMPSGFSDRVLASQATFRAVMDAMARPGCVQRIAAAVQGPAPLMPASVALVLTLCDPDTPVWLDAAMDSPDVARWLAFHTSAPITRDASRAAFALIGDMTRLESFDRFALGSDEYPDRSTTLIVQAETLRDGPTYALRGPGIDGTSMLGASLTDAFIASLDANHALFPRGVDCVLVAGYSIVALPRTTQLTAIGG